MEEKVDLQAKSMESLLTILDSIKDHAVDDVDSLPRDDLANAYLQKFRAIYSDADFRHSYSMISRSLGQYHPDERDSLPVFISHVYTMAEKCQNSDEDKRVYKSIGKLLDHIELECVRLNRMEEVKFLATQASTQHQEANALSEKVQTETKELEKKVSGFHEQSITILGIFSAVVVGFMAEVSLFTGGFNSLTSENVNSILFYCVVVGIIVFNTLFMLIFFIAKIAGTSLAVNRHPDNKGMWLFRTFKNYPYIYCFNIFACIAAAFLYYATNFSRPVPI